ncbi:MAG: asparaginase [Actinobacteria bacterium]|nr:asparaginase [Actinomycetota bacterium]
MPDPVSVASPLAAAPLAELTRDDVRSGRALVESSHVGHVVVVGPDGELAGALGDPHRVTFVRSSIKAFQATASLEVLAAHGGVTELPAAELAIGQASHRGEPRHLAAVRDLLARSATSPEELTTPPARPEAQPELPAEPLHYNCSGKHALFALAGRALGCPREQLLDPDGPLQSRVLAVLEDVLGPPAAVGVDGCGAPAVAVPLLRLAEAFRRLRTEDRWAPARDAALAEPWLVGGEGRLDSALLAAGVSVKVGAEGVYGASWTDGAGDVWGVAVKAEDGSGRAADAGLLGLLRALDVVPADVHELERPTGGGVPVGVLRPAATVTALGRRLAG